MECKEVLGSTNKHINSFKKWFDYFGKFLYINHFRQIVDLRFAKKNFHKNEGNNPKECIFSDFPNSDSSRSRSHESIVGDADGSTTSHKDICLLLEEFVVVTQLMIFPFELLGLAEKPMAGLISSKGKNHELRKISNYWR